MGAIVVSVFVVLIAVVGTIYFRIAEKHEGGTEIQTT